MSAHLTLTLDTAPPANPSLLINDGASVTGTQVVVLTPGTPSGDVDAMLIWGDLDPATDSRMQPAEEDSSWMLYVEEWPIRLSAVGGLKTVYLRLRDDVGNTSPAVSAHIVFDTETPIVTLTSPPDRSRVSATSPSDLATFAWESNLAFVHYEVRVVASVGAPHTAGVPIPSEHSVHLSGDGIYAAEGPISTTVSGRDLVTASPGDTEKIVKVFVRTADGLWSA